MFSVNLNRYKLHSKVKGPTNVMYVVINQPLSEFMDLTKEVSDHFNSSQHSIRSQTIFWSVACAFVFVFQTTNGHS